MTFNNKATNSHPFAKLPTEIQVEIWKLAADELLTNTRQMMDAFYSRPPPRAFRTPRHKKKAVIKRRESPSAQIDASSEVGIFLHRWPLLATCAFSRDAVFDAIRLCDKGTTDTHEWWFEPWQLKQRKVFTVDFSMYHKLRNAEQLDRADELWDDEADERREKEVVDFRPTRKIEKSTGRKKVDYVEVGCDGEEEGCGGLGCCDLADV